MAAIHSKLFLLFKIVVIIVVLFGTVYSFIFFEPILTEREIFITVTNFEKFPKEEGKYFVFTKDEVFENTNYSYHKKTNADLLMTRLIKGQTYRVKVVGFYLPFLTRFRNIIDIVEYNVKSVSSV
jgi:hypothetical protein